MTKKLSVLKKVLRLIAGALAPILIGSIAFNIIGSFYETIRHGYGFSNFFDLLITAVVIGGLGLGIQSVVYGFLMEFAVLPYIKRKGLVILASICICCIFPLPLYFIERSLFSYNDIELILIYLLTACITGAIVGYRLYINYHKQYGQLLK